MENERKYYIVEAAALPEVFLKVAETKRLLSTGEAGTVNAATQMTGISRSAFYKYRDAILPFQDLVTGRIVTFQFLLHDQPGALSNMLNYLADLQINILTINSVIPTNGCALVTISAQLRNISQPLEDLLLELRRIPSVIKAEVLAG